MKDNKIYDSWDKIEPDNTAQERMLNNILDRVNNEKINKRKVSYMTRRKILFPAMAGVLLTFLLVIPLMTQNTGNIIQNPDPINAGYQIHNPATDPASNNDITAAQNDPDPTDGGAETNNPTSGNNEHSIQSNTDSITGDEIRQTPVAALNETITLDEARNDPDFGGFLPTNIPSQLNFESASRFINQDFNSLFVLWHSLQPSMDSVRWQVSKTTDDDRARVVSVNESEKYDMSLYSIPLFESVPEELREFVHNPVFLAEEITLETIRARVLQGRGNTQISSFSVVYSEVVINIYANGVSPEQIWEMLTEITN